MIDIKALQDKILILEHDLQITRQGYFKIVMENEKLKQQIEEYEDYKEGVAV